MQEEKGLSLPVEYSQSYSDLLAFENREDPITLEKFSKIKSPVCTPHSHHIYEREQLIDWVKHHATDPMTREPLTEDQIISVDVIKEIMRAAKQIIQKNTELMEENQSLKEDLLSEQQFRETVPETLSDSEKSNPYLDALENLRVEMQSSIKELKQENLEIKQKNIEVESSMEALRQENLKIRKINRHLEERLSKQERENRFLKKRNRSYQDEIDQLRDLVVHPKWMQHGGLIEEKLKKGSSPNKKSALEAYVHRVKHAKTNREFMEQANDIDAFFEDNVKKSSSWFFPCCKNSETYKIVEDFLGKIYGDPDFQREVLDDGAELSEEGLKI